MRYSVAMRKLLRWTLIFAALAGLAFAGFGAVVVADGWQAFGKQADGARRAAMEASPQYADGTFENKQPLWIDNLLMVFGFVEHSAFASPTTPVPWQQVKPERFAEPPDGLRVTWLGHSTVLVEIDGYRVLTDPVWGERPSPVDWLGPARWYPPPLALTDLPPLDAIVLSHDHYDHLDYPTIAALRDRDTRWFAPLGVDAHLAYWGVPAERITAVDWGDAHTLDAPKAATGTADEGRRLVVHATESRHASGRQLLDQNATLWAGYALVGPDHRVFYSGDTGLFPGMKDIGRTLGPFDLTMIEVGAYHRAWPDWHIGPEQAVEAHEWLRGKLLLPVHWGLFDLAMHSWTEPIERTLVAAKARGAKVVSPRPGTSFDPTNPPPIERWWPDDVPWQTAEEHPIVSTKVDGRR